MSISSPMSYQGWISRVPGLLWGWVCLGVGTTKGVMSPGHICCIINIQMVIRETRLLPPANEVWGKVMFLLACVILFTGEGVFPWGGICIRGGLHPGGLPPERVVHIPHEIHGILRDMVNKRAVRILLEYFLFYKHICRNLHVLSTF